MMAWRQRGLCHCDIKPSNVVLEWVEGGRRGSAAGRNQRAGVDAAAGHFKVYVIDPDGALALDASSVQGCARTPPHTATCLRPCDASLEHRA